MSVAKEILAKMNSPTPAPTPAPSLYTQYTSSRIATCFITPGGKRINFTNYEYYTQDLENISYLDREIERGIRGIIKGKQVTAEDINPLSAQKRKHIEEFLASQAGRDFSSGKISSQEAAMKSSIMSSADVANWAAVSFSSN